MAKIKTKRQLEKKWNGKIKEVKKIYNQVRKENPGIPKFEDSAGGRDLIKRKGRAVNRWEHRKEINADRREKYAIRKEVEKTDLNSFGDGMTVFEAFSGKGRIFEDSILKANDGKKFSGIVEVTKLEEEKRVYTFLNYGSFRMWINSFLKELFSKDADGYGAFRWSIERYFNVSETGLLIKYEFEENES